MLSLYLTLIDDEADISKFEQIYHLYKKRMWYVANEILKDSYKAEDAVHNAFIGIAGNMHHIGDANSKATYAYVVMAAKNAALNIATRENNGNIIKLEDYENVPDDKAIIELCNIENRDIIESSLKQLPDTYRQLLFFRFCEDMSEKDIAKLTGQKYATVRKQISRAKKMLADMIAKEDDTFAKQ